MIQWSTKLNDTCPSKNSQPVEMDEESKELADITANRALQTFNPNCHSFPKVSLMFYFSKRSQKETVCVQPTRC
jgi:hypothetical protein